MTHSQDLIVTRAGIDPFAAYDGATTESSLDWTAAFATGSGCIGTRVLDVDWGACFWADTALGSVDGDSLRLDRLRHRLGACHGISLERSRLAWRAAFGQILQWGLAWGSLSRSLAGVASALGGGEEVARVVPAPPAPDACLMGRRGGEPMLHLRRIPRRKDGLVLEAMGSLLDPQRCGLKIAL